MKNFSKKNFSEKSNKQHKKNSDSNYYLKNTSSSKRDNRFSSKSSKYKKPNNLNNNDKNKSNFSSSKVKNQIFKQTFEGYKDGPYTKNDNINKRNFDDWIWGKHSVYEALISERAINRIWCTKNIFFRKFCILLKDLKSKASCCRGFGIG